jgi:hypothetical protein
MPRINRLRAPTQKQVATIEFFIEQKIEAQHDHRPVVPEKVALLEQHQLQYST